MILQEFFSFLGLPRPLRCTLT